MDCFVLSLKVAPGVPSHHDRQHGDPGVTGVYIALQDMQTFKNQAKIMLPFLVMLPLIKVSNCA